MLRIPAPRREAAGDAVPASPWFAPARLNGRPWILTFVGSEESFVDVLFRGVKASGSGFVREAWGRLLPYRDFAEPPSAMVDTGGTPLYTPALVEPSVAERPGTADELEEAMPSEAQGAVRWLRKLYLPLHSHFHVVSFQLECERPGHPRVAERRVLESGLVVRRLTPNKGDSRSHWEDWVPSPSGGGVWMELADEEMKLPSGKLLDPAALTGLPASVETALRARLGVGATEKLALSPQAMAPFPKDLGDAGKHSARFGFLPIASSDKERQPAPPETASAIAAALAQSAREQLTARVVSHASTLRTRIHGPLLSLAQVLLPPPPAPGTVNVAMATLLAFTYTSGPSTIGAPAGAADMLRQSARDAAASSLVSRWSPGSPDLSGASAVEAFNAAEVSVKPGSPTGFVFSNNEWLQRAVHARWDSFQTVMLSELWHVFNEAVPAPPSVPGSSSTGPFRFLMAGLLMRVRAIRVALMKAIQAKVLPSGGKSPDELVHIDPNNPAAGQRRRASVGTLSAELSGWIAAEQARATEPVPWPLLNLPLAQLDVHWKAEALEKVLEDVDRHGSGAGGAYAEELNAGAHALASLLRGTRLGPASAPQPLSQGPLWHGLDLNAQPERGLLIFPGVAPTTSSLHAVTEAVAGRYTALVGGNPGALLFEAQARKNLIRPRYDADSLYAVWCYARVAAKDPCEAPQLVWSPRTDVFSVADPMDVLGLKPVAMQLPDLHKMARDLPRIRKARALPFAAVTTPANSGFKTGELPADTAREWGIAWICSFGIPIFTICAWILFQIILSILLIIPGFCWLLLLKFCIPVPKKQ
ncbi:MAG TPA: hypothetical protein VE153_35755 [Myxococcus sp.]|nr:hypothetical protein [Myxococcus sp.]